MWRAWLIRFTKVTYFLFKFKKLTIVIWTYFFAILPLIEEWTNKKDAEESIKSEDLNIQVTEVKPGKETSGMVVDVLVKFVVGECKVVAHCYNTKQRVMVCISCSIYHDTLKRCRRVH